MEPQKRQKQQSRRILLVEDDHINQQIAKDRLEITGFNVLIAANGAVAINMRSKEVVGLAFMDCQMPVLDGFKTTVRFT